MDLGESIILNAKKQDSSNIGDIWSQFSGKDLDKIDPSQNQDEKPFDNIQTGKRITKDVKDMLDIEIKIGDNNNRININNSNENGQVKEINKVDSIMSDYLQNKFDDVNKDCFYIEPLLIPIQPIDNNYNSPDPISKFMDAL